MNKITVKRIDLLRITGLIWSAGNNTELLKKLQAAKNNCGPKLHDEITIEVNQNQINQIEKIL